MKKFKKSLLFTTFLVGLGVILASCQAVPVNAQMHITNSAGAGTKKLSALMLVDGSIQIEEDAAVAGWFAAGDIDYTNVSFTPKSSDGAKVSYIEDGYFTNPNELETKQAIWDEFNNVVKGLVPTGFTFELKSKQSAGWLDSMMDNKVADPTFTEWKAYIYEVSYSWANVEEYITKTKTLIGDSYAISELKEYEDAGNKWVTLTKNSDNTYTWKEAIHVNYWSVFNMVQKVFDSDYFDRAALVPLLGPGTEIAVENAFSLSKLQMKMGSAAPVTHPIHNGSGLSEALDLVFLESKGALPDPVTDPVTDPDKEGFPVWGTVLIVVGAVALVGAVAAVLVIRKKKRSAL